MPLIVGFAVPLLIGGVFQQVYNLVDVMIVGRYLGEQALAGVGSTGSLTFFMLSLVMGLCNGAGILLAQCFGVGNFSDMRRAVTSIIWIAGILTVIVMLIGVFACPFFLQIEQAISSRRMLCNDCCNCCSCHLKRNYND